MRSLGFFLNETIDGIRRHSTGSLVTFLQVFISLFILGLSLAIIINVNHFVDRFLNNLEMGAFLSDDLTDEQAAELMEVVERLPGVREVTYISKLEAFGIMQEITTMDISDLVSSNPMPASLKITVTSPRAAEELEASVELLEGVDEVRYGEAQLQSILPIFYGVELVSFFWVIFTAGATMMTIVNTVRLAILSRRNEIRIMQLVGATNWFIRLPFMLEGLLYGLGGAALALGLIAITYELVLRWFEGQSLYNPMIGFDLLMSNIGGILFFLGGLIGVIASLVAVGRHLETDTYQPAPRPQGATA